MQWGDVSPELVDDMVCYIRQLARGDEASTSKQIPRPVIITRIKRYYRAQRQQKQKASSPTRRRRRRFQNRKNRLTMLRFLILNGSLCALFEVRNNYIPLLADNARKRHTFRFEDIIFCDLFFHQLSNIRSMNCFPCHF